MNFEEARKVGDAVLYEGYVLYPYRASAAKNQVRWQFGVVAPKAWCEAGGPESWWQQTQCLLEADDDCVLHMRLRFLHVQLKTVEAAGAGGFTPVETLTVDGATYITWEEAVEHQVDLDLPVAMLLVRPETIPVDVDATDLAPELINDAGGTVAARVRRRREPLRALVTVSAERLDGPFGTVRFTVRTENHTPFDGSPDVRKDAMRHCLVACHTLLGLMPEGAGRFISLLEPPEWARPAVAGCTNDQTFPVLIGDPDRCDVMLSSPITLYDWPQVAPESPGDLFDATEIDEILILRTMTLTDEEKAEARATDPKAAAIIDRVDGLPPEIMDRLHGAVRYLRDVTGGKEAVPEFGTGSDGIPVMGEHRPFGDEFAAMRPAPETPWWDPQADTSVNPDTDAVVIAGVPVAKGAKVRLRPGARRSDVQDMFLVDRIADVQAVFYDLENKAFLAVTLEDDPNADIQVTHGRFLYFSPDEVEPLPAARDA